MSTHLPGFRSFSDFLHQFVLAKLATSCIRVKHTGRLVTQNFPPRWTQTLPMLLRTSHNKEIKYDFHLIE